MKRSLLMPLLAAGLMVTMALSLDSCKKTDNKTELNSLPTMETPVYSEPGRDAIMVCPYCSASLPAGTIDHTHLFGPDGELPPLGATPEQLEHWVFPVDHCNTAYEPDAYGNVTVCQYSGWLHDDEPTIQYMMTNFGYTHDEANLLLLPRLHRHVLGYRIVAPGQGGGTFNVWHVGGGTDIWP